MAWVPVSGEAFTDSWNVELPTRRRWFRRLDRDNDVYLYRYDQTNPDNSTLFASFQDSGAPQTLSGTAFDVSGGTVERLYNTAMSLTATLAGAMMDAGRAVNALQVQASQLAEAADAAVASAAERIEQIATEQSQSERNRKLRLGLRSMGDVAANVTNFVGLQVQLGQPYRNRLRSAATRLTAITTQLYAAL
jgi:hypothetical protein